MASLNKGEMLTNLALLMSFRFENKSLYLVATASVLRLRSQPPAWAQRPAPAVTFAFMKTIVLPNGAHDKSEIFPSPRQYFTPFMKTEKLGPHDLLITLLDPPL